MKVTLRRKKLADNRESLYLDLYEKGKRQTEYLNLYLEPEKRGDKTAKEKNKEIIELANKIRAKRETELANSAYGFLSKSKSKTSLIDYMHKLIEKKNANTRLTYEQCMNYLKKFAGDFIVIQQIDKEFIEQFIDFMQDKNLKNGTLLTYIAKLKAVMNKAIKDGIIVKNPFLNAEMPKLIKTKRDYLTLIEIDTLINTPIHNQQTKYAFIFACFTGLRISDIQKLTWQEIQNESVSIYQKKTSEPLNFPLTEPAKQILAKLERTDGKVFDLIRRSSINRSLKQWTQAAKIEKNVSFHTARHSFAVNYLSLGGDIFVLKELLGHSLLETTLIYADIINDRKIQAAKLFNRINI